MALQPIIRRNRGRSRAAFSSIDPEGRRDMAACPRLRDTGRMQEGQHGTSVLIVTERGIVRKLFGLRRQGSVFNAWALLVPRPCSDGWSCDFGLGGHPCPRGG